MHRPCFLALLAGACAGGGGAGSRTGVDGPPAASARADAGALTSAATVASAPAKKPPPAPDVGQASPFTLLAAAADARWIAYCSAEQDGNGDGRVEVGVGALGELAGDAMAARLLVAGKEPLPIDELIASDPRDRFVLVRDGEHYLVLDTHGEGVLDLAALGADLRRDVSSLPGHRALAFDHAGEHIAYLRKGAQGSELVLRALVSGSERVFPTPFVEIHRMEIAAGDRYAVFHAVAEDTNKNGRFDWPLPAGSPPRPACRGPLPRLAARYPSGDRAVKAVLPLGPGKAELMPDLVTPLGPALVKRAPSGELVLALNGKSTTLASAQCGGRVLHADAVRQTLLVGCTAKNAARAEVEIAAAGFRKPLKVAVQPTELDATAVSGERLVAVYPGAEALLVDLEARDVHALEPGDLVLAVRGSRALIRNRQTLRVYDAVARSSQKLDVELARLPDVLKSGVFVFVSPVLVDLGRGEIAGKSAQRPLALSTQGQLLIAQGGAASAERVGVGPLRWLGAER